MSEKNDDTISNSMDHAMDLENADSMSVESSHEERPGEESAKDVQICSPNANISLQEEQVCVPSDSIKNNSWPDYTTFHQSVSPYPPPFYPLPGESAQNSGNTATNHHDGSQNMEVSQHSHLFSQPPFPYPYYSHPLPMQPWGMSTPFPYPQPYPPFVPTSHVRSVFSNNHLPFHSSVNKRSNIQNQEQGLSMSSRRHPKFATSNKIVHSDAFSKQSFRGETTNPRYVFTRCAAASGYFTIDKKTGNWIARTKLRQLEDEFEENILKRQDKALGGEPRWTPRDRSEDDELDCVESDEDSEDLAELRNLLDSVEEEFDEGFDFYFSEDEDDPDSREEMLQLRASLREKKDLLRKIWEEEHDARKERRRKIFEEQVDEELLRVYNLRVRGRRQEEEVRYKMSHPRKLHPELWYNVPEEFNDGPACTCKEEYRVGPVHDKFEGETAIPPCDLESNNANRLFHYRIFIMPNTNFTSTTPTTIPYNGHNYEFEGFSIFTHQKIIDLPIIQILRYTSIYLMFYSDEDFPEGVTVRSMDMLTDFLFTELLELLDLKWFPSQWLPESGEKSCRVMHLLPRFVRRIPEGSGSGQYANKIGVELLPTPVILQYLLNNSDVLFKAEDLHKLHTMPIEEFGETISHLRGCLVTKPGWKPAAIRVDQVDRISVLPEVGQENMLIYPLLVHITVTPIKLSLRRDPQYKRVFRNLLRLEYTIYNKPRVTAQDKEKLSSLASKLESLETEKAARRQITAEISSDGFYNTGIRTDVSQHALIMPHFIRQLRFHFSVSTLEKRINYVFHDKALIHQALTHPSYLRFTYGTNGDHIQNSMGSCGLRFIEYGDRLKLFKEWRKKGLSQMIRIMSCLPNRYETRSNIFGNERLELLGDAVIEITCSIHLFFLFPDMTEGHLDAYRQALVQNQHLCLLAMRMGLHHYLLYAHGADFCLDSTFLHVRSDSFEAVIGAVALDGGLHVADRIFSAIVFGDNPRVLDVWCHLPPHPLQVQYPEGDRHWIDKHPLMKKLTELEERLGIQFFHIRLLAKSLTVRKTGYNFFTLGNNQTLEFLGDSLMKYVSTDYLFRHFPNHHEGHLSILKNSLVNKHTQSEVCIELGLEEFILKPAERAPNHNYLNNVKAKADVLEAFVGALFVDKDLKWVERFCQICFWPRLLEFILKQEWNDAKSKLQQCCLTLSGMDEPEVARYKILRQTGPTNKRRYEVGVYFRGKLMGSAFGWSVQEAEMNAAERAIKDHYNDFPQLDYQRRLLNSRYKDDYRQEILSMVACSDERIVESFVPNVDKSKLNLNKTSSIDLSRATPEQLRNMRTAGKLLPSMLRAQPKKDPDSVIPILRSSSVCGYNPQIAVRNASKPGGYLYTLNRASNSVSKSEERCKNGIGQLQSIKNSLQHVPSPRESSQSNLSRVSRISSPDNQKRHTNKQSNSSHHKKQHKSHKSHSKKAKKHHKHRHSKSSVVEVVPSVQISSTPPKKTNESSTPRAFQTAKTNSDLEDGEVVDDESEEMSPIKEVSDRKKSREYVSCSGSTGTLADLLMMKKRRRG